MSNIIYAYTRKDAIEDGMQTLVDPSMTTEAKIVFPVYITSGIKNIVDQAVKNKRYCNDEEGVMWDIISMLKYSILRSTKTNDIEVPVTITGVGRKRKFYFLAQVGPVDIDDDRPAITLMLHEER